MTLYDQFRAWEVEDYPEFAKENTSTFTHSGPIYMSFGPSWHAQKNLVTEDIIAKLQNGATLLSVGAGPAHLERLLVKHCSVPTGNITLADKSTQLPAPFPRVQFDLRKQWPFFAQPFDYVFFPECIGALDYGKRPRHALLAHAASEALNVVKPDGEIRMDGIFQSTDSIKNAKFKLLLDGKKPSWTYDEVTTLLVIKPETP